MRLGAGGTADLQRPRSPRVEDAPILYWLLSPSTIKEYLHLFESVKIVDLPSTVTKLALQLLRGNPHTSVRAERGVHD